MPAYDQGGRIKDGSLPGNQNNQQSIHVESSQAGPSSSVSSSRHNGHSKARSHDAGYRPQRQVESYTAGNV